MTPVMSTLQIAILKPMSKVPINNNEIIPNERKTIPNIKITNETKITISFPNILPIFGAINEKSPKANTGSVVNNPKAVVDNPVEARIESISGPTAVMAGRKLNEIKTTPIKKIT